MRTFQNSTPAVQTPPTSENRLPSGKLVQQGIDAALARHKASIVNPLALLRLSQVLELIPVARSSWWAGVKSGKYPQPVKLGPATTCWRAAEILSFIDNLGKSDENR